MLRFVNDLLYHTIFEKAQTICMATENVKIVESLTRHKICWISVL